jgi:hypothetical protein
MLMSCYKNNFMSYRVFLVGTFAFNAQMTEQKPTYTFAYPGRNLP